MTARAPVWPQKPMRSGLNLRGPGVRVGVADGALRQLRKRRAVPLRYYGARRIDQLRRDDVSRTGIGPGVDVGVERHAAVGRELRVRQRDVVLVEVHARVQRRDNRAEQDW